MANEQERALMVINSCSYKINKNPMERGAKGGDSPYNNLLEEE